jgi:sulfhydrogenase subunit beta (sulfur reductase)
MPYFLSADNLEPFLCSLGAYEVYAPVEKNGVTAFKKLEQGDRISIRKNADYSPKKLFLPSPEELFSYRQLRVLALSMERTQVNVLNKRRILFGIRLCDLQALKILDKVFLDDPHYKANRDNTILIAVRCKEPAPQCFCTSMNVQDEGYDLIFEEAWNGYVVESRSRVGEKLIDNRQFSPSEERINPHIRCMIRFKPREYAKENELHKDCLSCAACTAVCPTCNCYSTRDNVGMDLLTGNRERIWDYCQNSSFIGISDRKKRYDHRLLCKFSFAKKRTGDFSCVGCGRCKVSCPSGICDIPKIIGGS